MIKQVGPTPILPRHRASCHCGAVILELALPDGIVNPRRCDCSICRRKGAVVASAKLADITVVQGEDKLKLYTFNTHTAKHYFCSECGIYTHHQRRSNPQEYGYNVGCLDGVNPFLIPNVPVNDGVNHPADRPALRAAAEEDIPFLLQLRHQCMNAALIASGHTPSDDAHLQRIRYRFDAAEIVLLGGRPAGLLKTVRTGPVWDLIQIQVTPSEQGKGWGAKLLRTVMAQAMAAGASVKLSVFKVNPARRLYERLGFVVTGETDDAYDMLYTPG
jgi:ribosomal protein S18 acetylase RimI-like enzyme